MTTWYIARGAGLAALILLTASTCLGTLMSGRAQGDPGGRVIAQYVHRFVATLALAVLGLHLTTILADSFAHVGFVGALVPFASAYRGFWVGLGSIAAYCFLVAGATGYLRRRFAASARAATWWRTLHGVSYAGWGLAMLHGLHSGSDSNVGWVRWIYLACLAAVAGSVTVRVLSASAKAETSPAVAR